MEPTLIGHWRLAGDAEDASGNGHHGHNWGADLQAPGLAGQANGAAAFDGRASCIVAAVSYTHLTLPTICSV